MFNLRSKHCLKGTWGESDCRSVLHRYWLFTIMSMSMLSNLLRFQQSMITIVFLYQSWPTLNYHLFAQLGRNWHLRTQARHRNPIHDAWRSRQAATRSKPHRRCRVQRTNLETSTLRNRAWARCLSRLLKVEIWPVQYFLDGRQHMHQTVLT